jgi:hypothetical protein
MVVGMGEQSTAAIKRHDGIRDEYEKQLVVGVQSSS